MLALGYSSFVAIALPAIGYDSLCTYALLAIPAVVFTDVLSPIAQAAGVTLTLQDAGYLFARYIPNLTEEMMKTLCGVVAGSTDPYWASYFARYVPNLTEEMKTRLRSIR